MGDAARRDTSPDEKLSPTRNSVQTKTAEVDLQRSSVLYRSQGSQQGRAFAASIPNHTLPPQRGSQPRFRPAARGIARTGQAVFWRIAAK